MAANESTGIRHHADGFELARVEDRFVGKFSAMASPCEVLLDTDDDGEAADLVRIVEEEARRIEHDPANKSDLDPELTRELSKSIVSPP